ncbi:isochorismatase family protein [Streptomyces sp. NPDC002920]
MGFLAQLARLLDIPVTLSVAPSAGGSAVIEEASIPEAPVFVRGGPSALDDVATRQAITVQRRAVLALCGVSSEIVVLHTALDAIAAGFEVVVLLDACGGLSARTEQAAFRQIEAAGGLISSVASFTTDLVRDFTTPTGGEVITNLQGLLQQSAAEPAR